MSYVDSSLESPRVLGVCAGIGGLERGVRLAIPGARLVGLCERDSYAAAVLVARMEDAALDPAPVFAGDLHEFPAADFAGRVDLVCGGIPCQPYSNAGKQRRGDDERDLVDAFLALVRGVGPRYVFVENVAAFAADGLGRLLGGLAALGFDAEWTTLRASDVGAPHRRERCFVLAGRVPDAERDPIRQLAERGEGAAPAPERGDAEPRDVGTQPLGYADGARSSQRRGLKRDVGDELAPAERAGGADVAHAAHDHGRSGVGATEAGARPHGKRGRRLAGGSADVADGDGDGRTGLGLCGVQHRELRDDAHGRGAWPLPWPPGPADRGTWARVLADDPSLAPALAVEPSHGRMADGVSSPSHAASGGLDDHEERSAEGGAEGRPGRREMLDVREAAPAPWAPSPRLRQAARRGDSVPELSQPRGPGVGVSAEGEAAGLSPLPHGLQLGPQPGLNVQPGVCVGPLEPRGAAALGGEIDTESVHRVRRDVPPIEAARQDMQPRVLTPGEVEERITKALAHRTDRLRCLGNAVVPAQAAAALRELMSRLHDTQEAQP